MLAPEHLVSPWSHVALPVPASSPTPSPPSPASPPLASLVPPPRPAVVPAPPVAPVGVPARPASPGAPVAPAPPLDPPAALVAPPTARGHVNVSSQLGSEHPPATAAAAPSTSAKPELPAAVPCACRPSGLLGADSSNDAGWRPAKRAANTRMPPSSATCRPPLRNLSPRLGPQGQALFRICAPGQEGLASDPHSVFR